MSDNTKPEATAAPPTQAPKHEPIVEDRPCVHCGGSKNDSEHTDGLCPEEKFELGMRY